MRLPRFSQALILAGIPLALILPSATAQNTAQSLAVSAADKAAAASASLNGHHALGLAGVNRKALWASGRPITSASPAATIPTIPAPGFYPGDLSDPLGGPTIQTAKTNNLFVNCAPGCFGDPGLFENNLYHSDMIHITDQYVGTSANGRYGVGAAVQIAATLPHTMFDADVLAVVHAAASLIGPGYHEIYNVFLPPGQDICFTGTTICYSPDVLKTFAFCAYHASVDFNDIGHVIFTVEPFQNVFGCNVVEPSPNGSLIDSTADVLSHETFETITDPDGNAWLNFFSLDLFGAEIGDECQDFDFGYGRVVLNGKGYEIQPEYSNSQHGCAFTPYVAP